ncbi:MAG: hypothetical protein LVQ97_00425 [Candidatus Micrarchaeales archaeon]|nr:hypothetical protein [Candidatus Micrarchaeales archaeon]
MPFYGLLIAVTSISCMLLMHYAAMDISMADGLSSQLQMYQNMVKVEAFGYMAQHAPENASALAAWKESAKAAGIADGVSVVFTGNYMNIETLSRPRVYGASLIRSG